MKIEMNYFVRIWILLGTGQIVNSLRLPLAASTTTPPPLTSSPAIDFQVLLDPNGLKNATQILDQKAYEAEGKYLAWAEKSKILVQQSVADELEAQGNYLALKASSKSKNLEGFTQTEMESQMESDVDQMENILETMDLAKFRHELERIRLRKGVISQTQRNMNSASTFIATVHKLQALLLNGNGKFLQFSEIRSYMKSLWRLGLDIWKTRTERSQWGELCFKVKEIRNVTLNVKDFSFSDLCFD